MKHLLIAATGAALVAPASAGAATVRAAVGPPEHYGHYYGSNGGVIYYDAAPGETNRLTVTYSQVDYPYAVHVTVRDPGATVKVGDGCTGLDAHSAICDGPPGGYLPLTTEAHLGDGDDELRTARPAGTTLGGVLAFGGPGADLLDAGDGRDELDGGAGRDRLLGGGSDDILVGGDGLAPGSGELDGGDGADRVTYEQRTRSVIVDLAAGSGGEPGEGDSIRDVEQATGGRASDRLVGTAGANVLDGRGGADALIGRRGDDDLLGGRSRDRLTGGRGRDRLFGESAKDSHSCGAGHDEAWIVQRRELLRRDCETAHYLGTKYGEGNVAPTPNPLRVRRRSASFRIACPVFPGVEPEEFVPCQGDLVARTVAGRRLGHADVRPGKERRLSRMHFTRLGRRLIARRQGVVARMSITGDTFPSNGWTIRLRR